MLDRRPFVFGSPLWIRWCRGASPHLNSGGSPTINKPAIPSRRPCRPPDQLQSIWHQLPARSRIQLQHRLFFLALEKVGGISHEFSSPHALSRSPSQDSRSASQEIGGHLRSPIVPVSGREPPGEPETAIPVDRPGPAVRLAPRSLRRH